METRRVTIGEDRRNLLQKLADDKPVVRNNDNNKPDITISKIGEAAHGEDSTIGKENKEVVWTLVEKIPEDTLRHSKVMRKKVSVNMVNKRSIKEHKAKEKPVEEPTVTAEKIDLETPDQSIDGVERKWTESTPMPNVEEQGKKKFLIFGNADETTNNTPATIKDDSQTKRTSFTERIAAIVGTKRERGGNTNVRERLNVWNSFRNYNRSQTK